MVPRHLREQALAEQLAVIDPVEHGDLEDLRRRDRMLEMGAKARQFVRENFLLTRHLREYLTLMVSLVHGASYRIELG